MKRMLVVVFSFEALDFVGVWIAGETRIGSLVAESGGIDFDLRLQFESADLLLVDVRVFLRH